MLLQMMSDKPSPRPFASFWSHKKRSSMAPAVSVAMVCVTNPLGLTANGSISTARLLPTTTAKTSAPA
jgi:hypothetical protein